MEKKYLPIGTVCKVNNSDIMIIGYSFPDLFDNLNKKDYIGCSYPEGILLPNQIVCFNHLDISKIYFLGFLTEKHEKLSRMIEKNQFYKKEASVIGSELSNDVVSNKKTSSYEFDIEGNVITQKTYEFDESGNLVSICINEREKKHNQDIDEITSNDVVSNKKSSSYEFDAEGNVITQKTYEFDESGNLVSICINEREKKFKF